MSRNIGFIPMRGGSKRLPRKNLAELGGMKICHRVLSAAIDSECFDKIIVSTDDEEIAVNCKEFSQKIEIDMRPNELGSDRATVREVIIEFLKRDKIKNLNFETVAIMLATCPFRSAKHIREAYLLLDDHIDNVVGVCEYDFPWESAISINSEQTAIFPISPSPLIEGKTRSQDRSRFYHPNGSIYISRIASLFKFENYFAGIMKPYVMSRSDSIDIEEEEDLEYARFLVKRRFK